MVTEIEKTVVKIETEEGVNLPKYQTTGSSGFDVESFEDKTIPAGKWALVSTGIKMEIPFGYEIQVRSRSGLAAKKGVFALNSPGTVDSDYRGDVKVILANFSDADFEVKKGDRIAQLVLSKVYLAELKIESVSKTKRGYGGFGHTGV